MLVYKQNEQCKDINFHGVQILWNLLIHKNINPQNRLNFLNHEI